MKTVPEQFLVAVLRRCLFAAILCVSTARNFTAAEVPTASSSTPSPRLRLTEALRAKVEKERQDSAKETAIKMEKLVVREAPLPSGPPKDVQREGPFSLTQGGYLLKNRGERFSTEIGLWRHIDIIEDERDQLRQTVRIRMGVLRISW